MSKIISKREMKKVIKKNNPARTKDFLFCMSILFLPIVNFFVFNLGNYVSMFTLAFRPTVEVEGAGVFSNFVSFGQKFFNDPDLGVATKNSAFLYVLGWVLTPLPLLTSYYIFRKFPGSKYFQLMLMLPGMVAGMVWIMVFKYFMDLVLPGMMGWHEGLLTNPDTKFLSLVIYSVWFTLSGGLLIYTGTMSSVSTSVLEAGRLDGMNRLREFWHLLMPAIYPIFVINTVSGLIGFFSASASAFEFYGLSAPTSTTTIGYIMFTSVKGASADYGFNASGSILFSLVVAPLALIVKHLMEKYGPRDD